MARQDRGSSADLKEDVLRNPKSYGFFQAVRLLHLLVAKTDSDDSFLKENLRIRPLLSLGFPGTDLVSIEEIPEAEAPRFLMTVTFMGLYGSSSPLPSFYTEDLFAEASEDSTVTRDFMDIFNLPFYRLFYECWSRNRWHIKLIDEKALEYLDRLFCLLGLGLQEFRDVVPDSYRLLRYIGLFTQFPRSAMGLKTLLSDALDVPNLDIVPCIERTVEIPQEQRCCLGMQGTTLGVDCYAGQEIEDRMGKFRITAGPLDEEKFHRLLPGGSIYDEIGRLVRGYLIEPLESEVMLVLDKGEARTVCLGEPKWSSIGYDTWIFSGETMEEETSVTFPS